MNQNEEPFSRHTTKCGVAKVTLITMNERVCGNTWGTYPSDTGHFFFFFFFFAGVAAS